MPSVRSILYGWFGVSGRKPQHGEFISWIDSFWHKTEDAIPIANVQNLSSTLAGKTDTAYVDGGDANAAANAVATIRDGVAAACDTLKKAHNRLTTIETIIGSSTPDGDSIVNLLNELLPVFATYAEGVDIASLIASKIAATAIVNTLTETTSGKVLDARQGKALKDLIDDLPASFTFANLLGDPGDNVLLGQYLVDWASYNILIETNTATPSGVLYTNTTFEAALIGDNPNFVLKSFIQDGMLLKINCTGLQKLSDSIFRWNTEIVSFKDLSQQIKIVGSYAFSESTITELSLDAAEELMATAFFNCGSLEYINFPKLLSVLNECFIGCANLQTVILPFADFASTDAFVGCGSLNKLIVLERSAAVAYIETVNSFTAKILAN